MIVRLCWQVYRYAWFAWAGLEQHEICGTLTKVDSAFWAMNKQSQLTCASLITRNFLSYYVPMRNILYIFCWLWCIKQLCLVAVHGLVVYVTRSKVYKILGVT